MPKCEIFYLLDSHDFYTIKPLWVGDLGAQLEIFLILGEDMHHLISYAHAKHTLKFLMVMPSIRNEPLKSKTKNFISSPCSLRTV